MGARRLSTIGLGGTFRALSSRNYRLFFFGQGVSMVGTWMQQLAMSWLVYRLARASRGPAEAAWVLGAVVFVSQLPSFLVAPLAGVLADRWDRRRLVMAMQALAMLQALVLAGLTFTGVITIGWVIPLGLVLGIVHAVDIPARQSLVAEMVAERSHLPNAIALNSSLVNGARLVGPAIAGVVVDLWGEAWCFLVNGLSYLAVLVALWAMRLERRSPPAVRQRVVGDLKEGFTYVFGFPPVRAMLLLLAVTSLMGASYNTLLPVFARDVLGGDSRTQGFLASAAGLGALAGAIVLASRRSVLGLGRTIATACVCFGAGVAAFGFSRQVHLSAGLLVGVGFCMMTQMAGSNTFLQTIADDDKRGRVMSFYAAAFMGMAPFGALAAGTLARFFGAPGALLIGGSACAAAGLIFASRLRALRPQVRPIFVAKGLVAASSSGAGPDDPHCM